VWTPFSKVIMDTMDIPVIMAIMNTTERIVIRAIIVATTIMDATDVPVVKANMNITAIKAMKSGGENWGRCNLGKTNEQDREKKWLKYDRIKI
jgi:hypothetical protein